MNSRSRAFYDAAQEILHQFDGLIAIHDYSCSGTLQGILVLAL